MDCPHCQGTGQRKPATEQTGEEKADGDHLSSESRAENYRRALERIAYSNLALHRGEWWAKVADAALAGNPPPPEAEAEGVAKILAAFPRCDLCSEPCRFVLPPGVSDRGGRACSTHCGQWGIENWSAPWRKALEAAESARGGGNAR